jgi:hypothetical protein
MALSFSPAVKRQWRYWLVAVSLGHLLFIRRWYDLEHLQAKALDYYREAPATGTLAAATLLGSLWLALLLRLGWMWVERNPSRFRVTLGHCVFLAVLLVPLETMRNFWNASLPDGGHSVDWFTNLSLLTLDALLIIGIFARLRGSTKILDASRALVLSVTLLLPALLVDFGSSALRREPPAAFEPRTPLLMLPMRPGAPRVMWMLFDEFDPRLAFENRPASLAMPELDRLRTESLVATNVAPTDTYTVVAAPSLLSGRLLARTELEDVSTLLITPQGSGQPVDWRDTPTVFTKARALGVNAELVGWYHPYCRVLGDQMVRCFSRLPAATTPALALETYASARGLWRSTGFLFGLLGGSIWGAVTGDRSAGWLREQDGPIQKEQQGQYFEIRDRAYAAAVDPRIGLAYLHFPAPHMLPIYNRRAGNFKLNASLDYLDNLALVDRTVGEMRRKLEQAGLWDSTTLLVSSDHGLRPNLWRNRLGWTEEMENLTGGHTSANVPFILKLAGSRSGTMVEEPFSGVLTGDLALAVLRREVSTASQAAAWLRVHAGMPLIHNVAISHGTD